MTTPNPKGTCSNECGLDGPDVHGVPLAQFLAATEHVVTVLCGTFAFGYYSIDDIKQEIRVFCLEAMPKFDKERDLAKFLYVHAYRRLINLQRNKLQRNDPPCKLCHEGQGCKSQTSNSDGWGDGEKVCQKYMDWLKRNASKKSLAQPAAYSEAVASRHADKESESLLDALAKKEIWDILDQEMPLHLRKNFLKLKEGASLHKHLRLQVMAAIREILSGRYPEVSDVNEEEGGDSDG